MERGQPKRFKVEKREPPKANRFRGKRTAMGLRGFSGNFCAFPPTWPEFVAQFCI
jgi:hypothetical protein